MTRFVVMDEESLLPSDETVLILAALALGFTMTQPRAGYLPVTFNISESSLRRRAYEVASWGLP
jgi:hypothetical protein